MSIIAKATSSNYTPAPAGAWASVCVDIVDLGVLEVTFAGETKKQHKIRVVWQIDEVNPENGKPYTTSKRYTLSLHEKAALRKDLESWRGRAFTDSELEGFDVESVLGIGCLMNIIEVHKDGKKYSNIASLMKLPKGMSAPSPRDYVRVVDRPREGSSGGIAQQAGEESYMPSDEDVPF